jgi:hypothetical protein
MRNNIFRTWWAADLGGSVAWAMPTFDYMILAIGGQGSVRDMISNE